MPLRRTHEFDSWVEREGPSETARQIAWQFLVAAGETSWKAPSVPILDLSNQPYNETRTAILPVPREPDVQVWYRHYYATNDVDVIEVTQLTQ